MARIPKLDSAGRFLAADVNAQIDARTKATMRADLPALAKELKIGGGSGIEQVSGTVTLDASGDPIREFFTTGATTFKANGATTPLGAYTAVVWRRNSQGSWGYQVVQDAWTTPTPTPDTTAPVAGTLGVTVTDVKADLSVSGASDDRGYVSYSFSKDNGATWTAYQDSATYTFTGLTASTAYQFRHRVKDAAGNVTTGTAVSKTTAAAPPEVVPSGAYDDAVLADAPVAYFPLDDAAGATTLRNLGSKSWVASPAATGVTLGAAGIGDGATSASFDGAGGSHVKLTSVGYGAFTAGSIEFLASPSTGGGAVKTYASAASWWEVLGYNGLTWKAGPTAYVTSGTAALSGRSHVAAVWDGANVTWYVNGVTVATKPYTSTVTAATGQSGNIGNTVAGRMAGVAFYEKALTADRVLAHAKAAGLA